MEVDFNEFRRKDLQRLCKKHGLRANATNSQMAASLASFFKIFEKNKQGKVLSKGTGGNRSSKMEGVEGDVDKVVIVIDEDEDELGSVLRSANGKSLPKSRRSSEKYEQIKLHLEGPSGCDDSQGTSVKLHEENAVILLDEEDDEPCLALGSADRMKSSRSSGKVGKVCESSESNEENQPVGVLRNSKVELLSAARVTRSGLMNPDVSHSPAIEKAKVRKDGQLARQNAEPALDTSEVDGNEDGTREENPSVMMATGGVKVKRKRKNRNSSMKVNDEIMVYLPNDVSVTESLVGDVVHENHLNTVMGSGITFSIDGEQASQVRATCNEQDIEEHELCTAGNLMEVVAGSVGTRGKKRARAGLKEDSPVMAKEIDELESAHRHDLLHRAEILEPEVCFNSSQILRSPLSSNLASSRPCLLLSELHGGQDGGQIPATDELLSKQSGSLDRNGNLEMEEGLVRKNSIITGITMVEVDDTFCKRLCTCELDHVSIDEKVLKQSSATALEYSQSYHDIKECFYSVSANHVRNLKDDCNKCSIAEAHHNRCAETQVSMNNLRLCGEQDRETYEFAGEVTGFEGREECQDFEEVRGVEEGEKRNKQFKDNEPHIEKENESERQEGYNDRITVNCDFEKTSPVILPEKSIVEDICNISLPASNRTDEMNSSALQLVNIDGHANHNLFYLAEYNSEIVEREESQVVVTKQVEDSKTLVDECGAALGEKASFELEYLAETIEEQGKLLETWRAAITPTAMMETEYVEVEQQPKASLSSGKAIIDPQIFKSSQKFPDSQRVAETNSEQFFAPFESIVLQEELHQIKGGEPFKLEGNVQIIQDKLEHDGEKLCGSEEQPQLVGYDEVTEAKFFAGSTPAKEYETAPFGLSKRVDNLMEKLLCLTKVLRGEIAPLSTDSSMPCEEEISCKESPATSKEEMTLVESFSSHEQESQILNPADPVHEDCEQNILNSEVNIPNKIDEVTIIISSDTLRGSPELWKFMKSGEGNDTTTAFPYECDCYIRPALGEPCQAGDVDDKKFLETGHGVTAEPEEALQDNKFVSPSKLSSFDLEGKISSSSSSLLKGKLNNCITNSSAKNINHFGTKCLSETLDAHSSLTNKQADAKHTVDILKDEVAIRTSSEALQGNLELWKCMESYESDCTHNQLADAELYQDGDISVMDFLETTQGAIINPGQVLEKKYFSPSKQSSFHLEDERNSSSSCSSKKVKLNNNNVNNIPGKGIEHFGTQCLSKSLDSHSSLPIKQAYAKSSVDIFEVESQEGSIPGADILVDAVLCEVNTSFGNNTLDPVEEISHNFCVSSSRKAANPNILSTPITNSAEFSSAGLMKDKENTQNTEMKHSSKRKIINSALAGSIRRPLQSVTNQMID